MSKGLKRQAENGLAHDVDMLVWRLGRNGKPLHGGSTHITYFFSVQPASWWANRYLVWTQCELSPPQAPHNVRNEGIHRHPDILSIEHSPRGEQKDLPSSQLEESPPGTKRPQQEALTMWAVSSLNR